ncbi:MAG: hypothetical protein AAFV19_21085, partial [Pseudomonadota bacterium]
MFKRIRQNQPGPADVNMRASTANIRPDSPQDTIPRNNQVVTAPSEDRPQPPGEHTGGGSGALTRFA